MRPEGIVRESSAAVWYAGLAGWPAFNPDRDGDSVAEAVADLGTLASWHHASMSAYVISEVEVLDEAQGQRYRELAAGSIARYGGRYIVRGAEPEVPEGKGRVTPCRVSVRRFAGADPMIAICADQRTIRVRMSAGRY